MPTFSELKTKLNDWMNRSDLASQAGDFINISMHNLEREWNYACMENLATGTLATDQVAFPTRFKALKYAMINSGGVDYPTTPDNYYTMIAKYPLGSNLTGLPVCCAVSTENDAFVFRPYPSSSVTYTYTIAYWSFTADLSADSDTNWWTENNWEALLFGALNEASAYMMNDARVVVWRQKYEEIVQRQRKTDSDSELKGLGQGVASNGYNSEE